MGHVCLEPRLYSSPACEIARQRRRAEDEERQETLDSSVVYVDEVPYLSPNWLRNRIDHDAKRAKKWRLLAARYAQPGDADSRAMFIAYQSHALVCEYRINRRRRLLAEIEALT